ncbi:hypothetical protein GGH19_001043 [Coemansia sp. RSA 1807]|nr:hypothetical protein GGH19_001043 [Coemansia sp. RSA 1807]
MPESSPLTTSSLFAWLSQSLAPTDSSMVSTSTKSASSSTSDLLADKSSSVTSHGWALLHSTDSPSALSVSTTPSNSENTVLTSNTARSTPTSLSLTPTTATSIEAATSESNTPMAPLAWTTVDSSSSLQIIGSLAMLYPFTTSIPLLIAAPDSIPATASTNTFSRSITAPTKQTDASSTQFWTDALPSTRVKSSVTTVATSTQSVSATSSFPLADSSVGSTSAGSASSRIAPISGHISSPLTLFSGDMVELIVSHSSTPAATPDISISTTQNLFDLPITAERVEIPVSSEASQILPKRSLDSDASSLTAELLSEAAESARSLLSVMRNIATQSENSLPTRRNNSILVRAVRD